MTIPSEPDAGEPTPLPPTGPPREVQLSFWLWIATAGLILFTSIVLFLGRRTAAEQARNANIGGLTPDQAAAAASTTATLLAVAGLVTAALIVWAATKLRHGTGWARTLLTVAGVAVILFNMIGFSPVGLLTAITAFGGVITLHLRPAQDFFTAAKQSKQST